MMSAPEIRFTAPELDTLPPPGHPILTLPERISPHAATLETMILEWADSYRLLETDRQRERLADIRRLRAVAR
ncbi:hypothetical protein [Nocardia tengchongensis]